MNVVENIRQLAASDAEIVARLSAFNLRLDQVELIYRVEAPFIGEYEDILIHKGQEPGVSLVFSHTTRRIRLEVHPALLRERSGGEQKRT